LLTWYQPQKGLDAPILSLFWDRLGMLATEQAIYYDMRQSILGLINTALVLVALMVFTQIKWE